MADLERGVPITPETIFESGSVAKQFTAMSVLLAAQQGKLSIDDPLRKYLPELQDYGTPLTIRQVLSHVSGLREWRLIAVLNGRAEDTNVVSNDDILRFASKQRALNFDPGTVWSYSNTGFNLLPIVIERALNNGKTFEDFTREEIFEPLHMTHTQWRDNFRAVVPNRALSYTLEAGTLTQDTPIENIIGAGGLLTTVGDWLLWNENFTTGKVGGAEVLKLQQTPATLANGKTIEYAMGLSVGTYDGLREVSHGGATGGYRTWLARYPDQGLSVAVMCNAAQANPVNLGRETARLWTGATPTAKPAVTVDEVTLQTLSGMYRKTHDNSVVEVHVKDGKLMLEKLSLTASAPDEFYAGERTFHFKSDGFEEITPNGSVAYVRVEPVHPTASELANLAGKYESRETDSPLTVALKGKDLTMAIGLGEPVRLRPTFRDGFMVDAGSWGAAVVFHRDTSGKVTGLGVGDDRTWDVRFSRIK